MTSRTSLFVVGNYPSDRLTIGAGVAIFHLATARVVLCYHTRNKHWFLPKGRRNANEELTRAAEREGYEESGYRNRVLPLPMQHNQPDPDEGPLPYVTEAFWMQLIPQSGRSQYVLYWYAAETLSPEEEKALNDVTSDQTATADGTRAYQAAPKFPDGLTLQQRIVADISIEADGSRTVYEPVRHEGTGVDDEERLYTSELVPIDEAIRRLRSSVMEDVVRRAWDAVQLRMTMESGRV